MQLTLILIIFQGIQGGNILIFLIISGGVFPFFYMGGGSDGDLTSDSSPKDVSIYPDLESGFLEDDKPENDNKQFLEDDIPEDDDDT